MIAPPTSVLVWLATGATDMRRGMNCTYCDFRKWWILDIFTCSSVLVVSFLGGSVYHLPMRCASLSLVYWKVDLYLDELSLCVASFEGVSGFVCSRYGAGTVPMPEDAVPLHSLDRLNSRIDYKKGDGLHVYREIPQP